MRPAAACLVLLGSALAALACAKRGAEFDRDLIPRIQRGVTTERDIAGWFGAPTSVETRAGGAAQWIYLHEETRTRDTGSLTKIARSIASILGERVIVPPVDVASSHTTRETLAIELDADGIVRDYRYRRVDVPSRRVY